MSFADYRPANILYFPNVFPEKYNVEKMFQENIMEGLQVREYEEIKIYEPLPSTFYTLEEWPNTCDYSCWWCDREVSGIPVFVPGNTVRRDDGIIGFTRIGVMCSFYCAAAYIDLWYPNKGQAFELHGHLTQLYKRFYGEDVVYIPRMPPRTKMIKYSGNMTPQEYANIASELEHGIQKNIHFGGVPYSLE